MSTSTTPPAKPIEIDPYNASAVVSITTWFLMVASILALAARVSTKVALSRKLKVDDYTIFVALAASVGQDIAVAFQSSNGIGKHLDTLSPLEIDRYLKAAYASSILFVTSLVLSKISVLLLIAVITPVLLHIRLAQASGIVIIIWGFSSILVSALSCNPPRPWNFITGRCINQDAFWIFFAAFNILSEAALMGIPLCIIAGLTSSIKRRSIILACFSGRLIVVVAIAIQIYFQRKSTRSDPTFTDWRGVLMSQIVQNLSIMMACVPYLKPLLESLESGMIRVDDLRRKGAGSYATNSVSTNSYQLGQRWLGPKGRRKDTALTSNKVVDLGPGKTGVSNVCGKVGQRDGDAESRGSQSQIIRETKTWNIESE